MNIPNIEAFDNKVISAMTYICEKRYGYTRDLKPFGENVVNSMKAVGFLKIGCSENGETFGATNCLKQYLKIVLDEKQFNKIFKTTSSKQIHLA